MTLLQGQDSDFYGVVLRCAALNNSCASFYGFAISAGGRYSFFRYNTNDKNKFLVVRNSSGVAFDPGRSNILVIEAHGNVFTFTINGKPLLTYTIKDVSMPPPSSGHVGVYVESAGAEVAFSHLYIKKL